MKWVVMYSICMCTTKAHYNFCLSFTHSHTDSHQPMRFWPELGSVSSRALQHVDRRRSWNKLCPQCDGSAVMFPACFLTLEMYKSWIEGRLAQTFFFCRSDQSCSHGCDRVFWCHLKGSWTRFYCAWTAHIAHTSTQSAPKSVVIQTGYISQGQWVTTHQTMQTAKGKNHLTIRPSHAICPCKRRYVPMGFTS